MLATPRSVLATAGVTERDVCTQPLGVAWTGRQPIVGWALDPKESENEHVDVGLGGIVIAGPRLR